MKKLLMFLLAFIVVAGLPSVLAELEPTAAEEGEGVITLSSEGVDVVASELAADAGNPDIVYPKFTVDKPTDDERTADFIKPNTFKGHDLKVEPVRRNNNEFHLQPITSKRFVYTKAVSLE